jgi:hypothetical protein
MEQHRPAAGGLDQPPQQVVDCGRVERAQVVGAVRHAGIRGGERRARAVEHRDELIVVPAVHAMTLGDPAHARAGHQCLRDQPTLRLFRPAPARLPSKDLNPRHPFTQELVSQPVARPVAWAILARLTTHAKAAPAGGLRRGAPATEVTLPPEEPPV